jgi:O-antigen/teichoic acid export membrane protein
MYGINRTRMGAISMVGMGIIIGMLLSTPIILYILYKWNGLIYRHAELIEVKEHMRLKWKASSSLNSNLVAFSEALVLRLEDYEK